MCLLVCIFIFTKCLAFCFFLIDRTLRGIYFFIQSSLVEGALDLKLHLNFNPFNSGVTLGKRTVRAVVFLYMKCCLRHGDCLLTESVAALMPI